jgi:uncharacterized protein YwqG
MPDRRRFFKELLREAASVAQELNAALRPEEEELVDWRPPSPLPARPAIGFVDDESLLALCRDAGLEHRAEDVRRLARASLRLTPAAGAEPGRTRLGGRPDLPPGFPWPSRVGRDLGFVAQVNLAEVAAVDADTPFPRDGLLLFFYDLDTRPSGVYPDHRGAGRVVHVHGELERDDAHAAGLRPLPVELSRELQLQGAWSFQMEPLELESRDNLAWDELRRQLAAAQGVELEEATADRVALHRLLGYHDELGGEVELDCELAASGFDPDDLERYYEVRAEHEAEAREWRVLLQVSADDDLRTPPGEFDRLFFCIREADLRAGRFEEVWTILR